MNNFAIKDYSPQHGSSLGYDWVISQIPRKFMREAIARSECVSSVFRTMDSCAVGFAQTRC